MYLSRALFSVTALALSGLATPTFARHAPAEPAEVEVVAFIDPATGGFPEGMVVARDGRVFLTAYFAGKVKSVTPTGAVADFVAIDDWNLRGATSDQRGNLYIAGGKGVWKVTPAGAVTLYADVPGHAFLNDLVFDHHGDLYVTDSFAYLVWKVDQAGVATVWSADPLLQPAATFFPFPLGPNGLAFDESCHELTVANTCAGRLVRIPVKRDGSAGTGRTWVESEELIGADGVTPGPRGELYVAANIQNQIVRVARSGELDVLASGGLLSTPTAVAFGRGRDSDTLYICNNGDFFAGADPALQGLLKIEFDEHGRCRRGHGH